MTFSEARFRPSLEERLESIISGAALMADSSCTRDDRRERIVAECNAVRQALQDLLSEYMNNVSPGALGLWGSGCPAWAKPPGLEEAVRCRERGQAFPGETENRSAGLGRALAPNALLAWKRAGQPTG